MAAFGCRYTQIGINLMSVQFVGSSPLGLVFNHLLEHRLEDMFWHWFGFEVDQTAAFSLLIPGWLAHHLVHDLPVPDFLLFPGTLGHVRIRRAF